MFLCGLHLNTELPLVLFSALCGVLLTHNLRVIHTHTHTHTQEHTHTPTVRHNNNIFFMIFIALTFCLAGRRFIHLLTPVSLPKLPLFHIFFLFSSLVWRFCSIHIYGWATLCRIFHSIVLVFISFICHFCLYSCYCCCPRLFLLHFYVRFVFFRAVYSYWMACHILATFYMPQHVSMDFIGGLFWIH